MTTKTSTFSIIPKLKEKEPLWVTAVFWYLLAVLAILIILVLFFWSQTDALVKKNADLQQESKQLIASNKEISQRMSLLFQRLNNFSQLIKEHRLTSNLFVLLGIICHPRVQFTSLTFSEQTNHLRLGFKTENFKTLDEQLMILKSNPQVSNPKFSQLTIDKNGKIVGALDFDYDKKIISFFEGI